VKLSVILATRDRAHAVGPCLDSIAVALARAAPIEAEIIVVDNGSTDATGSIIRAWAGGKCTFPVRLLFEPKPGLSSAKNRALLTAQGDLLAFTDDDCRLSREYVTDLLRHYAADTEPVLRGGRVELGDPTDLPITIKTTPEPMRWSRYTNSARRLPIAGQIHGCNMTMPRSVVEKLGPFDERFGKGSIVGSGVETDYLFRAYLAYITLEYVPDMAVAHFHGRKTPDVGRELMQKYLTANGALMVKHAWKHPNLARPTYWDAKNAVREILLGGISTTTMPFFSHRDMVACTVRGALHYLLYGRRHSPRTILDDECARIVDVTRSIGPTSRRPGGANPTAVP
jgi:glycosyltransferase involved in cell wall biosynthesis